MTMSTLDEQPVRQFEENLEAYRSWWDSHPWWWRVAQRLWWIADTIYSVWRRRPGPGERLLMRAISAEAAERLRRRVLSDELRPEESPSDLEITDAQLAEADPERNQDTMSDPSHAPYLVDPEPQGRTGIFVRAKRDGRWVDADISELTAESLLRWLRSSGDANPLAENVVGVLLGHGHIVPKEEDASGD